MIDFRAAREAMVDCQIRPADVTRYAIIEAMLAVPRELFVPRQRRAISYVGGEVEVAPGRALLEPRVLAKMLEAAAVSKRDLVLELAPATGYSTALLARMAEAVIAIEPEEALAAQAQQTLAGLGVDNTVIVAGDPTAGDPAHAPFDMIFVNGAVERLPEALVEQLRDGGRLVAIFTGDGRSQCRVLTRSGRGVSERYAFDGAAPLLAGFERPPAFSF